MNSEPAILSLLEMTQLIRRTLQGGLNRRFWVKAEINKINVYKASGHAFLELVEKRNGQMVAQIKAVIWKSDYQSISLVFRKITGKDPGDGMAVLCETEVLYDPVYGLSLRITRIDPSYSLGEMEREKRECIKRLKSEGLFDRNKLVPKPLLIQRLAIISVENSKGYSDFREKIDNNPWGYAFFYQLFPALLQGDQAIRSIIRQLNRIEKVRGHFDAIAIIRGGGDDAGLSCYNSYELAKVVSELHLPLLSGIGHSTNETVVEMIAAVNAITPTDLADALLQRFHNVAVPLKNALQSIAMQSRRVIEGSQKEFATVQKFLNNTAKTKLVNAEGSLERYKDKLLFLPEVELKQAREDLKRIASGLSVMHNRFVNREEKEIQRIFIKAESICRYKLQEEKRSLDEMVKNINNLSLGQIEKNKHKLEYFSQSAELLDPQNVLNRGYSITSHGGKIVSDSSEVKEGDVLVTRLKRGIVVSNVKKKNE